MACKDQFMLTEALFGFSSACCVVLTELVLNDTNAQQIVQANGMYVLGMLVLPPPPTLKERERKLAKKLQVCWRYFILLGN